MGGRAGGGARSSSGGGAAAGRGGDIDTLVGKTINLNAGYSATESSVSVSKNNYGYSIDQTTKNTANGKTSVSNYGNKLTKGQAQDIMSHFFELYPKASVSK